MTPAFCHSIASFYDMYHLEPVGKHMVEVCTNLSCALAGAQAVLDAFANELGVRPGETTDDGEVTLRAIECAGGCGRAPVVVVDHVYHEPLRPEDVAGLLEELRGRASPVLLTAGTEEHDLTRLDEYRAVGGYAALDKARGMEPQAVMDEVSGATLRGRGGAGFPMGRKASLLAKDTGKPTYLVINADESEPGAFKDRDVMGKTPHRLIEGCLITAHGIGSQSVFIYIRGEYAHEFDVMREALEMRALPACSAA